MSRLFGVLIMLALSMPVQGAEIMWLRFKLELDGGMLPFVVEVDVPSDGSAPRGVIINGPERIDCGAFRIDDAAWYLDLPYYGAYLKGTMNDEASLGSSILAISDCVWVKERGDGSVTVPCRIRRATGAHDRFDAGMIAQVPENITGRWAVRFSSSPDVPAVGEFELLDDGRVLGTFLTTTGDYRFLEGRMNGSVLEMSCFDGAHAFFFRAEVRNGNVMRGDFWSGTWWHETWNARRDDDAALPDGFGRIGVVGPGDMAEIRLPSLDGEMTRLGDLLGPKLTIVELFGSWCPNCADASNFLAELKTRYGDDGLAIVGLAFELSTEPAEAKKRVVYHMRRHANGEELPWPVLLAGKPDKKAAAASIPAIDKVESYPTFVFLDERGRIITIYSGFMGPATCERFDVMRKALIGVVERGLNSPPCP